MYKYLNLDRQATLCVDLASMLSLPETVGDTRQVNSLLDMLRQDRQEASLLPLVHQTHHTHAWIAHINHHPLQLKPHETKTALLPLNTNMTVLPFPAFSDLSGISSKWPQVWREKPRFSHWTGWTNQCTNVDVKPSCLMYCMDPANVGLSTVVLRIPNCMHAGDEKHKIKNWWPLVVLCCTLQCKATQKQCNICEMQHSLCTLQPPKRLWLFGFAWIRAVWT